MSRNREALGYWRGVWRKARRFSVNLPDREWCNYWHTHFDWEGRGQRSRFEHHAHIRPLMFAFARAQAELRSQPMPCQVFVQIYPGDPGSDALYVHTPNPHSAFPAPFEDCRFLNVAPPLLAGLIDPARYRIGVTHYEGSSYYTILPPDAAATRQ